MSRFQTRNKINDKTLQVKKTKNSKIGKNIPLSEKSDKTNFVEKQLSISAENLCSMTFCTNCSNKSLHNENTAVIKSNTDKENEHLITEKPPGTPSKDVEFDLSSLELPQLNFLNKKIDEEEQVKVYQPQISDLCLADRQRIVHLVEEVARYKKEKEDDINEMNLLRRQLKEFEDKIKILKASENAKLKSINIMEIKHKEEENILKAKLSELSLLLLEMHKQKEITNEQVKAVKVQSEKLTEALQKIHNEKVVIEKLYINAKEELKLTKHVKNKLTKHMTVTKVVDKKMEVKSCQCYEEDLVLEKQSKGVEEQDKSIDKVKPLKDNKPEVDTRDFQILSELFFTKTSISQQDESLQLLQGHIANKYVKFDDFFID